MAVFYGAPGRAVRHGWTGPAVENWPVWRRGIAMNVTTFDSLAVARRLKAAGIEENQAEVLAESMREASATNRGDLATKTDVATLEAQINVVEARLKTEFKAEIASAVNRMTFVMLAIMGVLFAALKLF